MMEYNLTEYKWYLWHKTPQLTDQLIKEKHQRKALKKKACFLLELSFFSLKMANYEHRNVWMKDPKILRKELNFRCSKWWGQT